LFPVSCEVNSLVGLGLMIDLSYLFSYLPLKKNP